MDVKSILADVGFHTRKKLGQHFLTSENIACQIVEIADLQPSDIVLEIGTGLGILTSAIQKKVARVISVEIDDRWISLAQRLFMESKNVELICGDFLKIDLSIYQQKFSKIKIISNLPYHLSTEILFRLFEYHHWIESMTLMFQKEVSERICASVGTKSYGILSVLSQFYSVPKERLRVPLHFFFPKPKVHSSVVHLAMRSSLPLNENEKKYFKRMVKTSFGKRRKTLKNALENEFTASQREVLEQHSGIAFSRRAETLSVYEFMSLARLKLSAEELQSSHLYID